MNEYESQDEPRKLPEYVFKPFESPKISLDMIEAFNKAYDSMWKSDFIAFNNNKHKYKFSGFKESSPCAEAQVSEKPKPGHLFIQLREGEEYQLCSETQEDAYREMNQIHSNETERASKEYATDNQEPI